MIAVQFQISVFNAKAQRRKDAEELAAVHPLCVSASLRLCVNLQTDSQR